VDGGVAAFGGADRPWTAFVAGGGGYGVVWAFAEGCADGMDGRHVDDVEAHGGDLGKAGFDVFEGAVFAGSGGGGAGKELIPA